MNKALVISAFREHFQQVRDGLMRGTEDAKQASRVDGDHRPQNRGERGAVSAAAALSAALRQRVADLDDALMWLDRVGDHPRATVVTGALVEIDDGEQERRVLVLPGGQGAVVSTVEGAVTALSPTAPLVRAVAGLQEGDVGEFRGGEIEVRQIF